MNREVKKADMHTSLTYQRQTVMWQQKTNRPSSNLNEWAQRREYLYLVKCTPLSGSVKLYSQPVEGGDMSMSMFTWMMLHLDVTSLISLCTLGQPPFGVGVVFKVKLVFLARLFVYLIYINFSKCLLIHRIKASVRCICGLLSFYLLEQRYHER